MADYFVQASFGFTCSIDEAALLEEAWQLSYDLSADFDVGFPSDAFAMVFPATIEDDWKSGFLEIFDDPRFPGLGADFSVSNGGADSKVCSVLISGLTDFQPDPIAVLIQRCCRTSLAAAPVSFEWAYSCSKPRLDGFGGGWCIVFADRIVSGTSAAAISAETDVSEQVPPDTISVWDEDADHPVADWQNEVANGDTRLGYHGWMAGRRQNDGQAADDR